MADSIAPLGITNVYAPLSELKSRLSVQSSDYDGTMWQLLHVASRLIDRHCNRRFYIRTASRRFDVGDVSGFSVVDLISVNQIVEDWDGDGVYETTRSRSEYLLYPLDAEPVNLRTDAALCVYATISSVLCADFQSDELRCKSMRDGDSDLISSIQVPRWQLGERH